MVEGSQEWQNDAQKGGSSIFSSPSSTASGSTPGPVSGGDNSANVSPAPGPVSGGDNSANVSPVTQFGQGNIPQDGIPYLGPGGSLFI